MKDPQTTEEVEAAAAAWLANLTGWKKRYIESLRNELTSLRERMSGREAELRDTKRKLTDSKERIRRAHEILGVP